MDLIQENDMWDDPNERLFVEAFWEILGLLYIRERKAVERGGTRKHEQRCEDLNEHIRRMLTRSKTGPLLREAIADLMTRPLEMYRAGPDDSPATRSNLVDQIVTALEQPHQVHRFGGLSLGESSYLVDSVSRREVDEEVSMQFLKPDPAGS